MRHKWLEQPLAPGDEWPEDYRPPNFLNFVSSLLKEGRAAASKLSDTPEQQAELKEHLGLLGEASQTFQRLLMINFQEGNLSDEQRARLDRSILLMLVGTMGVGAHVQVPAAVKAQLDMSARAASTIKKDRDAKKRARLKEAIRKVRPALHTLAASDACARSIMADLRKELGVSESNSWPSLSSVKKAIAEVRREAGRLRSRSRLTVVT